jgi:DNA-binding NarL/FixJ family response regulator
MTNGKIHVFLLAQNSLVREALGRVLNKTSDIRVVAALGFGSTAIGQISAHTPDVVVLDAGGLASGDLEIIALILRDQPRVKIVTIAMAAEEDVSHPGLGVPGLVLQDPSVVEVIEAVRMAVCGGLSSGCDSDESNRFSLTAGTLGCTVPWLMPQGRGV